jgi:hypothetical protein
MARASYRAASSWLIDQPRSRIMNLTHDMGRQGIRVLYSCLSSSSEGTVINNLNYPFLRFVQIQNSISLFRKYCS